MVATRNRMAVAEDKFPERLPAQLVQDFHAAFGEHHARAVHTKGLILQGTYTPSTEASELCRAQLFAESSVPVVVRFSDFTGLPNIPDTEVKANPRGFAIKFLMPDGSETDIVNHSFNGFPVSTSSDFSALLQAIARSGGEPDPRFRTGKVPRQPSHGEGVPDHPDPAAAELGRHQLLLRQRRAGHGRSRSEPLCPVPVHTRGRRALPSSRRGGDEVRRLPVGGTHCAGRRQPGAIHLVRPARRGLRHH